MLNNALLVASIVLMAVAIWMLDRARRAQTKRSISMAYAAAREPLYDQWAAARLAHKPSRHLDEAITALKTAQLRTELGK